jgi:hypothetical protein
MCTLVILRRSTHAWPLLVAANRDERATRPFEAPDYHWPDYPDVVGGWDQIGGGTWFAVNGNGVFAAVLNRHHSLGPHPQKRSRGELPLEALGHADASAAAESMAQIDPNAYAPFNLVVADNTFACWLKHDGSSKKIQVSEIPEGYSMLTAFDRNDYNFSRVKGYLPRFQNGKVPNPETGDWRDWEVLMAQRLHGATDGPEGAMCVVYPDGQYGTVCSQMLAIPAIENAQKPHFRYAHGRPGEAGFTAVTI